MTVCTKPLVLAKPFCRPVHVAFDAPHASSDGGVLLLRSLDERLGVSSALGACVPDEREATRVRHPRREQVLQRVLQIAQGYEDCNDANHLRHDPALKLACLGDAGGGPLSSQPSLSRFENAATGRTIAGALRWFEQSWVDSLAADTEVVILDVDSTDDPTHGHQQLAMFHGFYDQHMYHPLLVFDGLTGQLITALLRGGCAHAAKGTAGRLRRLIAMVKARLPAARVIVRGDSAFAMPRLMGLLDELQLQYGGVDFVFGKARNPRLEALLAPEMALARAEHLTDGSHVRRFCEFDYAAESWAYPRRVIGKAEYGQKGANPRFLVTSLAEETPEELYDWYCQRGQVENDIKNFKRGLKADRLSCMTYVSNFFRLVLHMAAYRLMFALRTLAAPHSDELGRAEFATLRLRLLKVAALVTRSVRRVLVRLPASFGLGPVFAELLRELGPPGVA